MVKSTRRARRLSQRDRHIIEHVARYRLTTRETLHQLFFEENEPNAAVKVANRLCEGDWLRKFPLLYPRQYLVAGKRTIHALGLPATRSAPLGPQSLPTEYAVLQYSGPSTKIERLSRDEIRTHFEWYSDEWGASPHCLRSTDAANILELIRVDLGGPADHVARKCFADFETRHESPAFQQAVKRALFQFVVVTATSDKAAAVQHALQGHLWPDGISFHLAVIPELLPLLPGGHDAT